MAHTQTGNARPVEVAGEPHTDLRSRAETSGRIRIPVFGDGPFQNGQVRDPRPARILLVSGQTESLRRPTAHEFGPIPACTLGG